MWGTRVRVQGVEMKDYRCIMMHIITLRGGEELMQHDSVLGGRVGVRGLRFMDSFVDGGWYGRVWTGMDG